MTHEPGEGPRNPKADEAKQKAKRVLDDPKHKRDKQSEDDMETVDGDLPQQ